MKTIQCDRCKSVGGVMNGMIYRAYNIEYGEEPIIGTKKRIDLCGKCFEEFISYGRPIHQ